MDSTHFGVLSIVCKGLQRLQGRYPESSACLGDEKKSTFCIFGFLAGHVGRQKIPVVFTPTTNIPSYLEFRSINALYISFLGGSSCNIAVNFANEFKTNVQ